MLVKWKLFLIVILSIFTSAGAGVYITHHQSTAPTFEASNDQPEHMQATQISQDIVTDSERFKYKNIPLNTINSTLQGSDPATLALNAFDDTASMGGTRKVEVVYPQRNQALVTITQIGGNNLSTAVRYRVEMTTFGRSLLVSSPPVWQIVWAGSQVQCVPMSQTLRGVQNSKSPNFRVGEATTPSSLKVQNQESPSRDCYSPIRN